MNDLELVLASGNPNKLREFSEIFAEHPELGTVKLKTIAEVGFSGEIEENGTTFEENALMKANAGAALGYLTVADDSGLEVDALGGAPGVYSARYSGTHGNDKENNRLVLKNLAGVPEEKRTARFVSAVACAFPDGQSFVVRGTVEGRILDEEVGCGGFGYDPIFYSTEAKESFGVLSPAQKNAISHRGRAIRLFCRELIQRMNGENHANK